ncbi:hypothetical protein M0R72_07775 [Candidatus Pacearchaeota archaeon]|jgi:hypothetical protein|nr:hypothetical protein [Candidatus Pacearchaeota archaeon]
MATASFITLKCTGTGAATETDCSAHPCLLSADIVSTDQASYPIKAPVSGGDPSYSFELWVKLRCTAAPDSYCENFTIYGPDHSPSYLDTPADKVTINIGTTATGATPVNTASSVATARQDTTHYSVGTALAIPVDPVDSKINAVNEETNFIVMQLKVEEGATQGAIETHVPTLSWEEV